MAATPADRVRRGIVYEPQPDSSEIPARILVAGSDLLSGALANALETYGFSTMHIAFWGPEIERGIEWAPDLVIIEARSLDIAAGTSAVSHLRRMGLHVCVIDSADVEGRLDAWLRAGTSAFVDKNEPFTQIVRGDQPSSPYRISIADPARITCVVAGDACS